MKNPRLLRGKADKCKYCGGPGIKGVTVPGETRKYCCKWLEIPVSCTTGLYYICHWDLIDNENLLMVEGIKEVKD